MCDWLGWMSCVSPDFNSLTFKPAVSHGGTVVTLYMIPYNVPLYKFILLSWGTYMIPYNVPLYKFILLSWGSLTTLLPWATFDTLTTWET